MERWRQGNLTSHTQIGVLKWNSGCWLNVVAVTVHNMDAGTMQQAGAITVKHGRKSSRGVFLLLDP